jgi:hypothetical protein
MSRRNPPSFTPAPDHDPFEDNLDQPRTWWQRHAITVMAVFSLVMLVFVITFQTAC